jgi:hypothetical protein
MCVHSCVIQLQRLYADFGKEPPVDLLQRLQNIDARRHQVKKQTIYLDNSIFVFGDNFF